MLFTVFAGVSLNCHPLGSGLEKSELQNQEEKTFHWKTRLQSHDQKYDIRGTHFLWDLLSGYMAQDAHCCLETKSFQIWFFGTFP